MSKTILFGLMLSAALSAQVYPGYDNDYPGYRDYPRETSGYYRQPLDRILVDLERAAGNLDYLSEAEFERFNHAREEIREFQEKWQRGRFDRGELDDVISALQHIVSANRLEYRDRDVLLYDLARLREIRSRQGSPYQNRNGYGSYGYYRYDPYGRWR